MPCSNCSHFLSRGVIDASADPARRAPQGTAIGVCRRYPPKLESIEWLDNGPNAFSAFPPVHQDQVCGEWEGTMPPC